MRMDADGCFLPRWLSTIVALPIVMYTSWILYERGEFFSLGMDGMLHLKGSFHVLELTGHIQSMEIRVRGG